MIRPTTPDIPSHVQSLQAYQPGLPIETLARQSGHPATAIIKLASNENPYGMSPRARAALRIAASGAHRYPEAHQLHTLLAAHHDLTLAHITLGNGSNDILDLIARTFLGPGTEAISAQYAFAIYAIATQTTGATHITAPATRLGHDLVAIHAAITPATRIIWLANTNNPTGTFIPYSHIKTFLETIPPHIVVVLDEAYFEYLPPEDRADTPTWLATHPNLILVRTFSKIYGLAGLRVGYSLAHPRITEFLNRIRQPFNVNSIALATAAAALADQTFVQQSYQRNRRGLRQLEAGLSRLGLAFTPSLANFVTIAIPNAPSVYAALLRRGIIVRPLSGYSLPRHLRISVGRPSQNRQLLSSLAAIIRP